MHSHYLPAPPELAEVLDREVRALGGYVSDVFTEEDRLYARSVLPPTVEIRPGDGVHGGVALRTRGPEVLVHPYTFRVVCANGAIAAHATETRHVARVSFAAPSEVIAAALDEVAAAVRACGAPEALAGEAGRMRTAAETEADVMLHLLPHLHAFPPEMRARLTRMVAAQFDRQGDRTRFGLMNAVTAVARETPEPETRWRLEELGGALGALLPSRPRTAPPAEELMLVGSV